MNTITQEIVEKKIAQLRREEAVVRETYERLVQEHQNRTTQFQQAAQNSQNRFQQIQGAIAQLTSLLNGAEPTKTNQETNTP